MATVVWKDKPDDHDYPAAKSYLSLLAPASTVSELVAGLEQAPISHFKAKDLLRASRLRLLDTDNANVASDLRKINEGKHLSPILLVRGELGRGLALQIADGYHRVCASYHTDENTDIPCQIVDLPDKP
jgi:hypothetical protein